MPRSSNQPDRQRRSSNGSRDHRSQPSRSGSSQSRNRRPRNSGSRPQNRSSRPYNQGNNYRTIRGSDTGYNVRRRSIGFSSKETFWQRMQRTGNAGLILIVAGIIVLIILVLIIGGCARSCAADQAAKAEAARQSDDDAVVADGLSADLTSKLTAQIERNDKLAWIAKNVDKYSDTRLIELASNEPDAIDFVASVPDADKSSGTYSGTVTQGTPPLLYDFDSTWGYVDYGDGILGITGSGPTTLSMAYMGLTGKTDKTPADIASDATQANAVTGDSQMSADFAVSELSSFGITAEQYEVSADNLANIASEGQMMIVEFKANTITSQAHWALVVGRNDDGSYTLYDPTSALNSTRTWAAGTISNNIDALYALSGGNSGSSDGSDSSSDATSADSQSSSDSTDTQSDDSSSSSSDTTTGSSSSTDSGSSSSSE